MTRDKWIFSLLARPTTKREMPGHIHVLYESLYGSGGGICFWPKITVQVALLWIFREAVPNVLPRFDFIPGVRVLQSDVGDEI